MCLSFEVFVHRTLRWLMLSSLGFVSAGLARATAPGPESDRAVFRVGKMADEEQIALLANTAACRFPGVVLWDSEEFAAANKAFLQAFQPTRVSPLSLKSSPETAKPFTRAVVCPAEPRRLLLQAAHLAGAIRAPLFVLRENNADQIRRNLKTAGFLFAVGPALAWCQKIPKARVHSLADTAAITSAFFQYRLSKADVKTLVVANPADLGSGRGGMSTLAPWIAYQKKALLLLTNDAGTNVKTLVEQAGRRPELQKLETVILVGSLKALPMERRPNPIQGGRDAFIEMEPLTPPDTQPYSFAVGRLFHRDPAVTALMLARARLLAAQTKPGVLVVSNPGGGLPFLETLSRNTVQEFRNAGFATTALIGSEASGDKVRKLLPEQTVFLWEGHYSTLFRDYEAHDWTEPLKPSLIFLQSCLALTEAKARPFLEKGAIGVIGTSTRTYSASGGAFSLAYFDALVYDRQTFGGALRQAKNFMLAFALLKEKRLGAQAKLGGASQRAAWAFTLWGDPTLKLPRPASPAKEYQDPVSRQVRGNTIVITLPESPHEKVNSGKFAAEMSPNARLAGLVRKVEEDQHQLVPLVFIEVPLPKAPADKTPHLRTRLPDRNWVFRWDARRRCGYLLVTPRNKDQGEIRFQVMWK